MSKVFSSLFKKLKSIKHIEIVLAVLLGLIILLVYFSSSNALVSTKSNNAISTSSSVSLYTNEVECKLENLISKINGAGSVEVMVMCESDISLETDKIPQIKAVVVVATGASDVYVKLNIIKAVQALITVDASNIEVLTGGGG